MHFGGRSYFGKAQILAVTIVLSGAACGKAGTEGACKSATQNLAAAQKQAKLTQVGCFTEEDCNASVGMLAAAWSDPAPGVSVCTSFLIAPDVLATNSHCVPGDLMRPGASCADRIWVFFPTMSGLQAEQLDCDTVISNTGSSEKTPGQDIAFLRLKTRSTRPVLQLSRDGFADKEQVKLVKVNPEPGEGGACGVGVMQTVSCEAEQHSSRLPSFDDDRSPVVSLGICEVMHGNSGGPVLDSHGHAVGLIQAFFNPSTVDPSSLLGGEGSAIARLNVATSMACVDSPVDPHASFPQACGNMPGPDDDRHTSTWVEIVNKKMQSEANSIYAQAESSSPTGIRWKSAALDSHSPLVPAGASQYDIYLVPLPECVGRGTRPGSESHKIMLGHFRRGFDEFLVPSYRAKDPVGLEGTVTITPSGNGAYVELAANDSQGRPVAYFQQTVPACQ